jgi:hypothetical protein
MQKKMNGTWRGLISASFDVWERCSMRQEEQNYGTIPQSFQGSRQGHNTPLAPPWLVLTKVSEPEICRKLGPYLWFEEPSYEISDEMILFHMTADRVVKRHLALCKMLATMLVNNRSQIRGTPFLSVFIPVLQEQNAHFA